jgi:hypothetical protein
MMMMSFICSCRNKNEPNAIYPYWLSLSPFGDKESIILFVVSAKTHKRQKSRSPQDGCTPPEKLNSMRSSEKAKVQERAVRFKDIYTHTSSI